MELDDEMFMFHRYGFDDIITVAIAFDKSDCRNSSSRKCCNQKAPFIARILPWIIKDIPAHFLKGIRVRR